MRSGEEIERSAYSLAEVAAATGLSPATVWRRTNSVELPSIRVGRRILVSRDRLSAMLNGEAVVSGR